ncbi:hypothetical protein GQ42DRAFT_165690 [Ramicandelaber brevisporus]|nr:hypothetical protein GQ42DRAFT_165690 [Ramicandelaber brevisporus]
METVATAVAAALPVAAAKPTRPVIHSTSAFIDDGVPTSDFNPGNASSKAAGEDEDNNDSEELPFQTVIPPRVLAKRRLLSFAAHASSTAQRSTKPLPPVLFCQRKIATAEQPLIVGRATLPANPRSRFISRRHVELRFEPTSRNTQDISGLPPKKRRLMSDGSSGNGGKWMLKVCGENGVKVDESFYGPGESVEIEHGCVVDFVGIQTVFLDDAMVEGSLGTSTPKSASASASASASVSATPQPVLSSAAVPMDVSIDDLPPSSPPQSPVMDSLLFENENSTVVSLPLVSSSQLPTEPAEPVTLDKENQPPSVSLSSSRQATPDSTVTKKQKRSIEQLLSIVPDSIDLVDLVADAMVFSGRHRLTPSDIVDLIFAKSSVPASRSPSTNAMIQLATLPMTTTEMRSVVLHGALLVNSCFGRVERKQRDADGNQVEDWFFYSLEDEANLQRRNRFIELGAIRPARRATLKDVRYHYPKPPALPKYGAPRR